VVAAGVDLRSAVDAASRLPADILGRPDLGRIEAGGTADLVWLGDDLSARATWLAGRLAFGRLPGSVDGAAATSPAADRVLP
jgi:N-acetylglucosamine-6-phosphate deacetylase